VAASGNRLYMPSIVASFKRRRGRPRKFTVPSRPVTLTLPQQVIDALGAIDQDLSRAVVRLAQPELGKRPHPPAELATFGRNAVIVVNPTRSLEKRMGIALVHLPDGRALISFERRLTIADLELLIADALDEDRLSRADQAVFEAIGDILRTARRSTDLSLLQRSIIVLERRRHARRSKGPIFGPQRKSRRRA
jgi:hypothetical protein